MDLERKFCSSTSDLTVTDGSLIEGYASLFGELDQGGDVVARGAYAASLQALAARKSRVKMLWQHDPSQPIGVWDEVREDATGLYVRGRIIEEVDRGREAKALVQAGAIDGLSIGYRTRRASRDEKGRRVLTELELWEVSLVTFPMLAEARLASAKADVLDPRPMECIAAIFRDAARDLAGG
ncbi:HK97 family phage prohead protease [Palleronia sp. LCG004]|uniref:HK97 family phage prohead protease n=1 Tax=Palleronia sp. LCG004 TaxID=3079304 RepID=UPI002943C71E|nr:HK97 family phage prohead protease [Palleronia sp. LCG004]WOI55016.1 HK97 family phage prohead protease [Palleronia sp. LCG004]